MTENNVLLVEVLAKEVKEEILARSEGKAEVFGS
jgi:hypothetical protein